MKQYFDEHMKTHTGTAAPRGGTPHRAGPPSPLGGSAPASLPPKVGRGWYRLAQGGEDPTVPGPGPGWMDPWTPRGWPGAGVGGGVAARQQLPTAHHHPPRRGEAVHLRDLRQELHQPAQHEAAPAHAHRREALPLRRVRPALPLLQHAQGAQGEVLPRQPPPGRRRQRPRSPGPAPRPAPGPPPAARAAPDPASPAAALPHRCQPRREAEHQQLTACLLRGAQDPPLVVVERGVGSNTSGVGWTRSARGP